MSDHQEKPKKVFRRKLKPVNNAKPRFGKGVKNAKVFKEVYPIHFMFLNVVSSFVHVLVGKKRCSSE